MKTGFIGYGSMNSMLIRSLLRAHRIAPETILISTRTIAKTETLAAMYPGIEITDDNGYLAERSSRIIIGVKPLDLLPVISKIQGRLNRDVHLISMAACVRIPVIESAFSGMITRIIPSLCNEQMAGVILCCHNRQVDAAHAEAIEDFFGSISRVMNLDETLFEPATDLMGCAPGIFAAILEEFVRSGCRNSGIDPGMAYEMALRSFIGTGQLMGSMTPAEIIPRVATPGGITEEGIQILRDGLPALFDTLFARTGEKNAVIRDAIARMIR